MYRIIVALVLAGVGVAPAAAQTSTPKPLPPATVARIRAEAQRPHQFALRGSPPAARASQGHGPRRQRRATPAQAAFTPRPPKAGPAR